MVGDRSNAYFWNGSHVKAGNSKSSFFKVPFCHKVKSMKPESMNHYFGRDLEAMSFADNYHRWILSEFLPYIGVSVAEVGAGVGNFSDLILETNVTSLMAFEPSSNMYPLLKEALSKDKRAVAINGFFGKKVNDKRSDPVIYVNVLEHIEDDASELAAAHDSLNPDGHLLLFVPALPWLYSEFDRQVGHFRRYTRKPC